MSLSPEARGTFAALKKRHRIKYFTPDCAEALVAAGLAKLDHDNTLTITKKGIAAAAYAEAAVATGAGGSHA